MPEQAKKPLVISIYVILAVSTLLVYWQVRNFGFINYDDNDYVYENSHVISGFTFENIKWAFTTNLSAHWHPLTWLSLMLDCQLFGVKAGPLHLVNIFLHLANTLLLFSILKKMTGSLWPSAFVAAAFAIHPMHVESVTWIAERKDVLSTFFMMLTLTAYAGYVRRSSAWRYIAAIIAFAMGLMAKSMLVTLPCLLLLLDYWPLNRLTFPIIGRQWRAVIIEKIPFFILSFMSSVVAFLLMQSSGMVIKMRTVSFGDRIVNVFSSYIQYITQMFWPHNLAPFYPLHVSEIPIWWVVICILLLLVISFLAVWFGRTQKYLFVGWFWFVGTLVPVIGIIQVGTQAYADRYTYIPYIGLFIMLVWSLRNISLWRPRYEILTGSLAVVILAAFGVCAYLQAGYWRSGLGLFSHAMKVTKGNYIAYNNYGVALSDLGCYKKSLEYFKNAIRIWPGYDEAYNNIGVVYFHFGNYDKAISAYKKAVKIQPTSVVAYKNLGISYIALGRHDNAIEMYRQVVKLKPDYVEGYNNIGFSCTHLGRFAEAVEAYQQAIKIKPDYAEAYYNLGNAYSKLNRYAEAAEVYQQAIKLKPDYAEAYTNLGFMHGRFGRYQQEIELYKQALKFKPDYVDAHNNLVVAYLATGDNNSALTEYDVLKSLDPNSAKALQKDIDKVKIEK